MNTLKNIYTFVMNKVNKKNGIEDVEHMKKKKKPRKKTEARKRQRYVAVRGLWHDSTDSADSLFSLDFGRSGRGLFHPTIMDAKHDDLHGCIPDWNDVGLFAGRIGRGRGIDSAW